MSDGGGQNELGMTDVSDTLYTKKVVSVNSPTTSSSGTFYITNNGGRGYDNEIVLLLSVKEPIPDDFSVNIKSSGYTWTPAPGGVGNPAPPTNTEYSYLPVALDETFTKSDFIYGPQTFRPAPGAVAVSPCIQAMYNGQDLNDTAVYHLMFIDLKAGNLGAGKYPAGSLIDNGAVKVQYSITGLASLAAFNGYGWVSQSNQGEGINFTNPTADSTITILTGYSVHSITYNGPPIVISATPADAATNIPINSFISATFNTAMDGTTITASTFTVQDQYGGRSAAR